MTSRRPDVRRCRARRRSRACPHALGMLSDVRDPQLVRTVPLELALDEVNGCRERRGPTPLPAAGQALEASTLHQQLDLTSADIDATTKPQLRVDATSAVSLAGVSVDLADLVGQPRVTDRPFRWRPDEPRVVAAARHLEHAAGSLDRQPFSGHHTDRREPPFGSVASVSSSTALFAIAQPRAARCDAWPQRARLPQPTSSLARDPHRCGPAAATDRSTAS